jgi:uncharacterized protein YceH (UPF0502 family)
MTEKLDPLEARVLGVLIEKALTTPDQYPLSLNALVAGCNQKSNRDPVLMLSEAEVRLTLDGLRMKHLAGVVNQSGGRVERYTHGAAETLGLPRPSLAVLAELLLRGPQAPGELRGRASRMAELDTLEALQETLERLRDKGLAEERRPAPGSRAPRIAQLLAPDAHPEAAAAAHAAAPAPAAPRVAAAEPAAPAPDRLVRLEAEVARLRRQLEALAARLGEPLPG